MTKKFSGFARLILAISIMLFVGWFGFRYTHPWIIVILGVILTPLYIAGKWRQWKRAWLDGGVSAIVKGVLITMPIQTLFAGLFYVIGLGIGALMTTQTMAPFVTQNELVTVGLFFLVAMVISVLIIFDESRVSDGAEDTEGTPTGHKNTPDNTEDQSMG